MKCSKIRVPGGFAIICGSGRRLTMADAKLIDAQTTLLERTRKAVEFHHKLAAECNKEGLPILAREHDFVAKTLEAGIGNQLRAFRDGTLVPKEGETNGKKQENTKS